MTQNAMTRHETTHEDGPPYAAARQAGAAAIGEHPWRAWPHHRRTLQDVLRHAGRTRAEDTVLTVEERTYTGAELVRTAARAAAFLDRLGVRPGDRVVVIAPNRAEHLEILFGCAWSGAVFVPLNPALRGDLLRHQLRKAAPAVVCYDRTTGAAVHNAADAFGGPGPALVHFSEDALDRPAEDPAPLPEELEAAAVEYVLGAQEAEPEPVGPHTTAAVLFTSGTTGPAKGVVMPHGQFYWWSLVCAEQLQLRGGDVLYTCLPLFHTNALTTLLQALAAGGSAVVGPKFSVSAFWDRLDSAGASVTFLLGAMTSMLWNRRPPEQRRGSRLRLILGPGIDAGIKADFERHFGVHVAEGFGMTEIGVALYTPVEQRTAGVLGIPHPDYEVGVVDADAAPVPDGAAGELVIRPRRPYLISEGYFGDEQATMASRRNLWFHTGDLVSVQPDGMYRYLDRIKDSIRRRGENISSHEVETVFLGHCGIAAAAAVAVPSELGEDEVMVCLQPGEGAHLDPAEVIAFAEPHLPHYAVPRYVRVLPRLPLTANGKIAKQALRDEGVTPDTWEKGADR
jgi:carnitine-CoA ligase